MRFGDASRVEREFDSLSSMRVLGQLQETYLVAETPDGLALIDQHAADERINYEELQAAFESETMAQVLAEPVTVSLTVRGVAADAILADLACYPSVTAHTALTEGSILDLLDRPEACTNPYACPHGRPVVIEIGGQELDERFERDCLGHDG
jgi:DNA mismatch repair protein MutL